MRMIRASLDGLPQLRGVVIFYRDSYVYVFNTSHAQDAMIIALVPRRPV